MRKLESEFVLNKYENLTYNKESLSKSRYKLTAKGLNVLTNKFEENSFISDNPIFKNEALSIEAKKIIYVNTLGK